MRISVSQMRSGIDPEANCASILSALSQTADDGAAFLSTPEMALLLDRDRKRATEHVVAEEDNRWIAALREGCAKKGVALHLGSVPVSDRASGKWLNRSLLIGKSGEVEARYDKIHLFDVDLATGESWRESNAYIAGDRAVTADFCSCPVGLSVCYDIRFPSLYNSLAAAGARILFVPAAFTVSTGRVHWQVLLRARAIENACFVVAAAQTGQHEDGRETYGRSMVISPWGEIILDMGDEPGVTTVDLDLAKVEDSRTRIPVIANRRSFSDPVSR